MSLVLNTLKTDIASELLEFGEFVTDSGGYLEKMLYKACKYINSKWDWDHQISSSTISTTEGTKGPYNAPSDFLKFVTEERLSRVYDYDRFSLAIVPDGNYGKIYEVYWNRGEAKIYFRLDPGTNSHTFYYIKKFTAIADISDWEDVLEVPIITLTKSFALANSRDTRDMANEFKADFKEEINLVIDDLRKGQSLQEMVEVRDVYGNAMHSQIEV